MFGIVALALIAAISAQITCPSVEVVLTNIYDDMGGVNWNTNNWFSTPDYCNWTGIDCNQNNDVIYLDLSGLGLTGPISVYFECFKYLKSLYLNNNRLTGSIPTALCELTNLSYIQIQNSGLTGTLQHVFATFPTSCTCISLTTPSLEKSHHALETSNSSVNSILIATTSQDQSQQHSTISQELKRSDSTATHSSHAHQSLQQASMNATH
eukprot:gnl/Chilomastix_caulleri/8722.p1 GENE.gnl/Chilomastix_caulleri/8722~~gnl/Chilomastix_caulleri/8722.p1  ORF type:complete len:210 (+),score=44.25 gnl/Chilomastix_caulleri/8722:52-681(+)